MSTWRIALLVAITGCMGQLDPGPGGTGGGPSGTQLDASVTETPPTPDAPPALTPMQVLAQWSGCMSLTDFQTANMAEAWGNMAASNNQLCRNCHGDGGFSFIASLDENFFFTTMSEHSSYMVKFFSLQGTDVIVNTGSVQNAGVTLVGHPRFDPVNNPGMLALKTFYDATKARQVANTCDPARMKD